MNLVTIIFLFSLLLVVGATYDKNASTYIRVSGDLRWTFLHYHKTGTYLDQSMSNHLFDKKRCPNVEVGKGIIYVLHPISLANSHVRRPVPSAANFSEVFNVSGLKFRVVHFIREPFDMAMSGYIYHKQTPPPYEPDGWLETAKYDPCYYDANQFDNKIIPALSAYTENKVDIAQMIKNVVHLCNKLRSTYIADNYNNVLNIAHDDKGDYFPAVLLNACQALLDNVHGQILLMAQNILSAKEAKSRLGTRFMLKRSSIAEFPVTDVEAYLRSMQSMFDFLMPAGFVESDGSEPFYGCLGGRDRAIEAAMISSYSGLPVSYSSNSSYFRSILKGRSIGVSTDTEKHITSSLMSSTERLKYMSRLQSDPVVGPLLSIVRRIVMDKA